MIEVYFSFWFCSPSEKNYLSYVLTYTKLLINSTSLIKNNSEALKL